MQPLHLIEKTSIFSDSFIFFSSPPLSLFLFVFLLTPLILLPLSLPPPLPSPSPYPPPLPSPPLPLPLCAPSLIPPSPPLPHGYIQFMSVGTCLPWTPMAWRTPMSSSAYIQTPPLPLSRRQKRNKTLWTQSLMKISSSKSLLLLFSYWACRYFGGSSR